MTRLERISISNPAVLDNRYSGKGEFPTDGFGSLAALQDDISLMSAFGGGAAIQIVAMAEFSQYIRRVKGA